MRLGGGIDRNLGFAQAVAGRVDPYLFECPLPGRPERDKVGHRAAAGVDAPHPVAESTQLR